jgi:hypothetical protein
MNRVRNKYIPLLIILLSLAAAGFVRAHNDIRNAHPHVVRSAQDPKYKDATIAHRFHQNHFKRHRFQLDGALPVQQDTVISTVIGTITVAPVQNHFFPTPSTPLLRGPPAA